MSRYANLTTLDLHGKRLEDAISEVTIFLDRIRRTVAAFSRGRLGEQKNVLYVTIITGSGSHSTHGPVLRGAVEKLLQKRGMIFRLERGGGAFKVDALSGWDIHAPVPATESKVVVAENDEFHQMAFARRKGNNAGNFASATMAQRPATSPGQPRRSSVPNNSSNCISPGPLPSQVASEDTSIRVATKLSSSESQQKRNRQCRVSKEYERQYQRALSESQLEFSKLKVEAEEDYEESQMETALERSIEDDQHCQQMTEKEYENALMLAMEQSTREANETNTLDVTENQYENDLQAALQKSTHETKICNGSEDDLIQQALAESRALAEAEKSNTSEDDFLEKALAESLLEEERRRASELLQEEQSKCFEGTLAKADERNISEDEVLEKALAESLLEEERRKASLLKEEQHKSSREEEEALEEVMRLSLLQNEEETMTEEEALIKAIEMSKQIR
eukprot:CAMPEP_0172539974 /NCGR_PEP_ID=MMETSP1067-20121228/11069_1 /TAXON_ID=265564 ORGANISM="Thalassiosira punctigera, Strain Tpunct2005C2" /NCGR_SAMPLE_ID=MMETSP1067 /ASSEMBLY_ACC=CAM_ASM_000444 /LENGTH=451 /DNA_ID=CAMNT_0013325743 /DNA_START=146 /DNA_END=1501 /DNA_ORIENTATION=-